MKSSQPGKTRTIQEVIPAQVPRRFPVGTLLLMMAVFAVLLSGLRTANVPPTIIVFISGYVVIIGLAQVLLFKGQKPREASLYAGVFAWVVLTAAITIQMLWQQDPHAYQIAVVMAILAVFLSAPFGYMVGGALAGVFLILDRIRTGQWNQVRSVEVPVPIETANPFGSRTSDRQPILETERLWLRSFELGDASQVQQLAGDAEMASTTASLPHPYRDGTAEIWISLQPTRYNNRDEVVFAVVRKKDQQLVGAIGLRLAMDQAKGELGYWIGRPYWNHGYATEAAQAIVDYGFRWLGLISILAHHMTRNPASGRVLQKIGMRHTGTLREYIERNGTRGDCEHYEIVRYEWSGAGEGKA